MFDRIRTHKLFNILAPMLVFAILIVLQIFLYEPLVGNKNNWQLILFYVGIYLCILFFAFFIFLHLLSKSLRSRTLILVSFLSSTILMGIYLGIIYLTKALSHNLDAYYISLGIVDLILIVSYFFSAAKLSHIFSKKALIVAISLFLVVIMGSVGGFVAYFNSSKAQSLIVFNNFEVRDTLPNGEQEKIKVILLAGQSNASGASLVSYLSQKENPEKFTEYSSGYENILINYFNENGNTSSNGEFVPVTLNQGCMEGYFGPEVGLADTLASSYPSERIFIIKYAWGGTNLFSQWLPPSSDGETGLLYTAFVNYVKTSMDYLIESDYNAEIVAMCWMQGESDADDINCLTYEQNTTNLVSDLRTEFAEYVGEKGMLFVDAGIADSIYWKNYTTINQAKLNHANLSEQNIYIDTIAEGLTVTLEPTENPDLAHYDALSEIKLGNLFAQAIVAYLDN